MVQSKIMGRGGPNRTKIGVILTLEMAKNGPKIHYFSMGKGLKVPILMFLGQMYLLLISLNKKSLMWRIWGV